MKRKAAAIISIFLLIYVFSYLIYREAQTEVWESDGEEYVIFPDDQIYLYYFYRPLSQLDAAVTGMKFHIGQHR